MMRAERAPQPRPLPGARGSRAPGTGLWLLLRDLNAGQDRVAGLVELDAGDLLRVARVDLVVPERNAGHVVDQLLLDGLVLLLRVRQRGRAVGGGDVRVDLRVGEAALVAVRLGAV